AHKGQRNQKPAAAAIGKDRGVNGKEAHADEAAHQGAEKAVAAVELAGAVVTAHAEDDTNAGEGRTAVQKVIYQGAQRGCQSCFDVSQPHAGEMVRAFEQHGIPPGKYWNTAPLL